MKNIKDLERFVHNLQKKISTGAVTLLQEQARQMESEAQTQAPEGIQVTATNLANGVDITARGENAAYLEFGTGQYVFDRYQPQEGDDKARYKTFANNFYKTGKGRLRQHPYLFPAFFKGRDEFFKHLIQELKKL